MTDPIAIATEPAGRWVVSDHSQCGPILEPRNRSDGHTEIVCRLCELEAELTTALATVERVRAMRDHWHEPRYDGLSCYISACADQLTAALAPPPPPDGQETKP